LLSFAPSKDHTFSRKSLRNSSLGFDLNRYCMGRSNYSFTDVKCLFIFNA